jgi:hypothetical protein
MAGKCEPDKTLIQALRNAYELLRKTSPGGVIGRPESLVIDATPRRPDDRNLCRLVFLAPDIQSAILDGRQPHTLTLARLLETKIPPNWDDQRQVLGFPC